MAKIEEPKLSISQVADDTGLPISTIRFYEKEFDSYLRIQKTTGGHRRYRDKDVEKLKYIKSLVQDQGKSLQEVRDLLVSDEDPAVLRHDLNLLLDVFETLVAENHKVTRAVDDLGRRLSSLEEALTKKKRFSLFG